MKVVTESLELIFEEKEQYQQYLCELYVKKHL